MLMRKEAPLMASSHCNTYWLEGDDRGAIIRGSIVNGNASVRAVEVSIRNLRDTLIRSIPSFEIHICSPVI
jgi:endonuclease III-like uncharacterized protein